MEHTHGLQQFGRIPGSRDHLAGRGERGRHVDVEAGHGRRAAGGASTFAARTWSADDKTVSTPPAVTSKTLLPELSAT